jgi:hypothetical protein
MFKGAYITRKAFNWCETFSACSVQEEYIYIYIYIEANLLATRLAIHMLRAIRYGTKIRATVSCHLLPFTS